MSSKKTSFRSDRYQFTVIMPNLNYNALQSGTQDGTQDDLSMKIKSLIQKDNKISTEKMSMVLGTSIRTIKRRIKEMQDVCFVGHGFHGRWDITEREKTEQESSVEPIYRR